MSSSIHLGYEVATGRAVEIPLRHMAVTGQTQESGKTTTLEALITRSGLRAVAYVTKRGESSFHVANPIAPYFQERADWKFVQSLLEAAMETRMDFKQPWIMRMCDGAKTLEDVRTNLRKFINGVRDERPTKKRRGAEVKEKWLLKPARGLSLDVYYVLDKYFDDVMPQIQNLPYTTELELAPGVNVMDLREYEFALQALVVRSVIDRVRLHEQNTINVIPEAWKFAPKQKGSPVRLAAEELIREGGALKNFLWIDSQDLAGVADVLMRQVGVWIFGVQRAKHEITRALEHIPEGLMARRPRPQDIATLSKGQFYVCFGREMFKVYVQPAWMSAAHAEAIARGEEEVETARDILHQFDQSRPRPKAPQKHEDEREKMWKEKYEKLELEHKQLIEAHDAMAKRLAVLEAARREIMVPAADPRARAAVPPPAFVSGSASPAQDMGKWFEKFPAETYQAIYQYVRKQVREDLELLEMLARKPQIDVKIERPVVKVDTSTLHGKICQLLAEGFFAETKATEIVAKEAIRRGFCHPKTPHMRIIDPLEKLTRMGFLTYEVDGYQAVPGMKVNVTEA